ncbi:MAG: LysM peptidoglycan-binding domain-containing protein, partial [Anaerolineales bacterium]|nr:LysM peptidoglycan-binding domain-containing protein [Anaerolineales bacterium]
MRRLISLIAVLLWLGPTACGSGPALPAPVPQAQVSEDEGPHMATAAPFASPRPYQTATPAPTPSPIPLLTEIVLPTPTPFTYTVAAGDTLNGIAARFDVRPDDLLASNPGVSPTPLQVGTLLTIPLGGNTSGEPTPTPVPLTILQTD